MAEFFTLDELTHSNTAKSRGIDNTPGPEETKRLKYLMDHCLDPIRRAWGKPITVNSGYRCKALNAAVGGVANSQHLRGEAADITTGSVEGNRKLFEMIAYSGFDYDQVIDEKGYSWVHVSCKENSIGNRKLAIHL